MKKDSKPKMETIYQCPQALVTIVKKHSNLNRWPKHGYPCFLYLLQTRQGTRIASKANGIIEFMPAYEDLVRMLIAIEPSLERVLPRHLKNKPLLRKEKYDAINKRRHASRKRVK